MHPDTFCNSLNRTPWDRFATVRDDNSSPSLQAEGVSIPHPSLDHFTTIRDDKLPSPSLRATGVAIQNRSSQRRSLHLPQKQQGFLMPLAIFIVVIMGIFTVTLARTTGQSAIATTQEGVSLQAFYAAESGAQLGMSNLFYDTAAPLTVAAVTGRCTTLALSPTFTVNGLNNCSATVSCVADTTVPGRSYFTLSSTGQCGNGNISANRTIQVSAKME